ncbi:MAG: hypothetical protein ACO20H_05745 [Bacteriovoracaceae bacterium]
MKTFTLFLFALFLCNQALGCGGTGDKSASTSEAESAPKTTYISGEEAED